MSKFDTASATKAISPILLLRNNLILSDCVCEQQICSTDYTPPTSTDDRNRQPPVYQIAKRHLQQAMIPGNHIKSVILCDRAAYEVAVKAAKISNTIPM